MSDTILVAIISGLVTLTGTVLAVWKSGKEQTKNYEIKNAVIDEKIENLTNEVKRHNRYEEQIQELFKMVAVIQEKLNNLEKGA